MNDRIKEIPKKLLEFWNKYTSKQKTIIISVSAAVILTLVALVYFTSQTKYVAISTFETTAETAEAKNYLTEQGIESMASDDGLTLSVDKTKVSEARLVLGQNGISETASEDYSFLFDNTFSTTESEKALKIKLDLQSRIATDIKSIDGINQASVRITLPDTTNSIYKTEDNASASILITTSTELSNEAIQGIAQYVATSIDAKNTDNIRIIDQTGELLFTGEGKSDNSVATYTDARNTVILSCENKLRSLLLVSGVYDDAEVFANLDVDLDEKEILNTEYYSNDTDDTGPKSNYYIYTAENTDGTGDVVGTSANDETVTDYDISGVDGTGSTVNIIKEEYETSSTVTSTKKAVGTVNTANSSVAIVLNKYVTYDETLMEEQGLLKDTTFEQFQADNSEKKSIEVPTEIYDLIQKATLISEKNISVIAYEVPVFYPKEESSVSVVNYLQIILAVLIVALLMFVVFKGMKPVEVTEVEPELSVEALLATTKENQTLDDIDFSDKSASRQQIEKFVDENPEAVALLLRNWLNEDWE